MTRPELSARDIALGMDRAISRRDFVNGVAVALGSAALAPATARADDAGPVADAGPAAATAAANGPAGADYAGQTLAAAAPLHARRDGAPRPQVPPFVPGGEAYDLIVVGAGISGLAAAWWWRQVAPQARVLLVDALDRVGGHAQRNEFVAANGRRLIGYGGSEALDSPSLWSPAAHAVIRGVGIDIAQFTSYFDSGFRQRHGLTQHANWYAPSVWGRGTLVRHAHDAKPADWIARTPLVPQAQADLLRLLTAPVDPFPRLTRSARRARLAQITYDQLLVDALGLHPQVAQLFNNRTRGYIGVGTDATSALDAFALGLPGFEAMKLGDAVDAAMSPSGRQAKGGTDDYIYPFPDGNAGVARALVRSLVPAALPGSGMESLVLASLDAAELDREGAPVRIRLGCPVVNVQHAGEPAHARAVDVTYADGTGALHTVRAAHVVLACFHRAIPFLCPELPPAQVDALNDQVKVPLLYGTVLIRHWQAFARAGIAGFELPGHLWEEIRLDMPVSIGRYRFPDSPDEPMLLHLSAVVLDGPKGRSEREQAAAGRRRLLSMPFAELERELRATLDGALGPFGFVAADDIEAITINRWAHGYAYEYMRPWDAFWPAGPLPIHTARKGWGRVAIANADGGAYAYVQGAIDQATRAVAELKPHAALPRYWRTPGPSAKALKLPR